MWHFPVSWPGSTIDVWQNPQLQAFLVRVIASAPVSSLDLLDLNLASAGPRPKPPSCSQMTVPLPRMDHDSAGNALTSQRDC